MRTRLSSPGFLLAAALSVLPAVSNAQGAAGLNPQTAPSGVAYVTGGVGDGQQQAMKDLMKDYNLRLTFARPNGDYLAAVKVRVEPQGKGQDGRPLLDVTSTGPMLYAKVDDGNYRVRADAEGQVQTKTVSLKNGAARELIFRFPEK